MGLAGMGTVPPPVAPVRLVSCGNEGCDEQVSLRSVPRHVDLCLCETVQVPSSPRRSCPPAHPHPAARRASGTSPATGHPQGDDDDAGFRGGGED